MGRKLLRSLGSLLFLGLMGVLVLYKYQDTFSLNHSQSIMLMLVLVTIVFTAAKVSVWLEKHLPWKESVIEWISIAALLVIFAPIFIFFIL